MKKLCVRSCAFVCSLVVLFSSVFYFSYVPVMADTAAERMAIPLATFIASTMAASGYYGKQSATAAKEMINTVAADISSDIKAGKEAVKNYADFVWQKVDGTWTKVKNVAADKLDTAQQYIIGIKDATKNRFVTAQQAVADTMDRIHEKVNNSKTSGNNAFNYVSSLNSWDTTKSLIYSNMSSNDQSAAVYGMNYLQEKYPELVSGNNIIALYGSFGSVSLYVLSDIPFSSAYVKAVPDGFNYKINYDKYDVSFVDSANNAIHSFYYYLKCSASEIIDESYEYAETVTGFHGQLLNFVKAGYAFTTVNVFNPAKTVIDNYPDWADLKQGIIDGVTVGLAQGLANINIDVPAISINIPALAVDDVIAGQAEDGIASQVSIQTGEMSDDVVAGAKDIYVSNNIVIDNVGDSDVLTQSQLEESISGITDAFAIPFPADLADRLQKGVQNAVDFVVGQIEQADIWDKIPFSIPYDIYLIVYNLGLLGSSSSSGAKGVRRAVASSSNSGGSVNPSGISIDYSDVNHDMTDGSNVSWKTAPVIHIKLDDFGVMGITYDIDYTYDCSQLNYFAMLVYWSITLVCFVSTLNSIIDIFKEDTSWSKVQVDEDDQGY